jgi:hypothetical protein
VSCCRGFSTNSYTLFNVPGAQGTIARAINDSGYIVGEYEANNNPFLGFLRYPNGTFKLLPGEAYGINNNSEIVGRTGLDGDGFVIAPDGTISYFSIYTAHGQFPPVPLGINDQGEIVGEVVGVAIAPNGFIGTPGGRNYLLPEPSNFWLVLPIAGLCLLRFYWAQRQKGF